MTTAAFVPQQSIRRAATIAWATALGPITAQALAERDDVTLLAAREQLDGAVELELMEKHAVLVGYPDLYTVTIAGRRLARELAGAGGYIYPEGLRTAGVNIREARHMIACAGVIAALERRYPDHRIIGERVLQLDERTQKRRLASVQIRRHGQMRSHVPDVVIWPPGTPGEPPPLPIAVEVELTLKSNEEITAICRAWARCRYVEAVLYYVETTNMAEKLLDTIERLKVEEIIVVNPLIEILKPLPGFPLDDQ